MATGPYVIDTAEDFRPDDLFLQGREQLLLAVRITPVFGQLDLSLIALVVDEANARGMSLIRESPILNEHLLLVLDAYDDEDDEDEDE